MRSIRVSSPTTSIGGDQRCGLDHETCGQTINWWESINHSGRQHRFPLGPAASPGPRRLDWTEAYRLPHSGKIHPNKPLEYSTSNDRFTCLDTVRTSPPPFPCVPFLSPLLFAPCMEVDNDGPKERRWALPAPQTVCHHPLAYITCSANY